MEEYDGVAILATNLRKNLDEAFVRRLPSPSTFRSPRRPTAAHLGRHLAARRAAATPRWTSDSWRGGSR